MKANEKYDVNFTEKNETLDYAIGNVTTESELKIVNKLVNKLRNMDSVETIYCYHYYDVNVNTLQLSIIATGDTDKIEKMIRETEMDLYWRSSNPHFHYSISVFKLEDMINMSHESKISYLKGLCYHKRFLTFLLDRHGYFYNLVSEAYCKTDTIDDFKRLGELDTEREAKAALGRKFTPNKEN